MIGRLFRVVKRTYRRSSVGASPLVYSNFMQATTGAFYFGGGVVGLIVAVMMPDGPGSRAVVVSIASFAIVVGTGMVQWGARMPRVISRLMLGLGPILIGFASFYATSPHAAFGISVIFLLAVTDAALFCPPLEATFYVSLSLVCNVVALAGRPDLEWWASVPGCGVMLLVAVSTLVLANWAGNADIDGLTGLLNRRGFDRSLRQAISSASAHGEVPAVVFFDIDNFKRLNDVSGHSRGDEVLIELARTWSVLIPSGAKLARYGGDEFALLVSNLDEVQLVALAEELRQSVGVRCSAGATTWVPGESTSLLTGRADVALYRAKNSGRNRVALESGQRTPIASELKATMTSALEVAYQPIVRLDEPGNPIVAVEALVRWKSILDPDLRADELIQIAEASGLIVDLDSAVLRRACEESGRMQAALGSRLLKLHVNASGLTLLEPGYLDTVQSVLLESGWPSTQLVIEVTETVVDADNTVALDSLAKLRAAGIGVAIDDFGTGYSSLGRLQSLPADEIKLDGAFVEQSSTHGTALLGAVAVLGRALRMETIVERVETGDQAKLLTDLGFPMAQGYYFGRPMSCADLVRRLSAGVRTIR